jgi:hypothetical protein
LRKRAGTGSSPIRLPQAESEAGKDSISRNEMGENERRETREERREKRDDRDESVMI